MDRRESRVPLSKRSSVLCYCSGTLSVDESEYETVPEATAGGTLGGGRYVIEAPIGKGGMARVYRALDTLTGRHIALKQLRERAEGNSQQRSRELFEREFHTMSELTHPRIVAAIDYGVDAAQPYYTMELLDGGDLLERAPLGWRDACAVTRDICSALSLLHSRRLVYRDLSPRNVRCTSDGKAKLIDLGAMAKMGSAQLAVCTPAVASPEVVYRQELDGRSDLYALGATLYCTLVARSAYPARTFQQLIELWQRPLLPPSEFVADIPPALDALVMELLQLDPALRPASAAEVSQRVSAIAGLHSDEQLLVSQAYLSTPSLVGRERELEKVAGMVRRASRDKRGAAVLVRGAAGMGRSRFLDACALSAKLAGLTVLRASAAAAPSGPFGVAQALASQLLELLPDETVLAAQANQPAVLAALLPELRAKLPRYSEPQAAELQLHAPPALRGFLLEIARQRPLLIAVDDVERFDPDSRALCALLAHKSHTHPLVFAAATSVEAASESDEARLLSQACAPCALAALSSEQTHALLASMFGEVPNLSQLVRRTHALAAGNPQNVMRLAQHLLDRDVVRYSGGAWALPDRIDDGDLPATMAQTFAATIAALEPDARALAQAFAHYADQRFTFDECLALCTRQERAVAYRSLDQLVAASVLSTGLEGYALASPAWVTALASELDPELAVRLSHVFMKRGDGIRAVGCLYRGGREREGTELLAQHARESHRQTSADTDTYVRFLATLPADWPQIFQRGLELAQKLGLPAHDGYLIQMRLGGIMSQNDFSMEGQAAFAQRLAQDVGLDLYAKLDPALPPAARLQQALAGAAARYASTPENERVLDPKSAIGTLARIVITAIGNFSRNLDVHEWRKFPSVEPIAALSPSIAVVERLARGFDARLSGRFEDAVAIYRETLALLANGDAGLDSTFAESVRAALPGIIGFAEAVLGLPSSLVCADEVAKFPLFHGSALAIRMLDRLWQGDVVGADRIGRERELWRLEQARQQTSDVLTVVWTSQAHAASDDLTHARQDLEAIERTANKMRPWQPIALWARGEYERIRGDHEAALVALDGALALVPAGTHQIWPCAAGARLKVLCQLGRVEQARSDGERYVAIAREHGLGYVTSYLRMPLAVACAQLGDAGAAWEHARAAIESFERLGARGLHVGLAHEAAARVALALGDLAAFEQHAAQCKARYLAHPNPALAAKYQRLTRLAQRTTQAQLDGVALPLGDSVLTRSQIESALTTCATSQERLQCALQLLVKTANAERGYLYGFGEHGPELRASSDRVAPPREIESSALTYLQYELARDGETATATATAEGSEMSFTGMWNSGMQCYLPVPLNHRGPQGFMIGGLAVLMIDSRQPLRAIVESATQISQAIVDHGDLTAFVVG